MCKLPKSDTALFPYTTAQILQNNALAQLSTPVMHTENLRQLATLL